jgi:hypothetical protein
MAKNKTVQFNCRLSLVGGVVEETFGEHFGAQTTGGLHDRFIFGLCPKPHTYLYRPYEKKPETLNPVMVEADPEVWEARNDWIRSNAGLTPRIAEHALRVAAICASFDGRKVLRAKDLGPALEFARYQVRVRTVLEPNPGRTHDAQCAHTIIAWLRSNGSDGRPVEQRMLYRRIHANRFGPGIFDRALTNLKFNGDIMRDRVGKKLVVGLLGEGSDCAATVTKQVVTLGDTSLQNGQNSNCH